jgi:hypothetical protein
MTPVSQTPMWMRGRMVLGLGVALIVFLTWAEAGMAKPKGAIYKQCACICQAPETLSA